MKLYYKLISKAFISETQAAISEIGSFDASIPEMVILK